MSDEDENPAIGGIESEDGGFAGVGWHLILWLLVHFGCGVLAARSPMISTGLGLAAMGIGAFLLFTYPRPQIGLSVAMYLGASDVVWRMNDSMIPWEAGKYAAIMIALILLIRTGGVSRSPFPYLALALLIAGIPIALQAVTHVERLLLNSIRFNSSGPLCMFVCAIAFGGVRIQSGDVLRILVAILGPAMMVSAAALYSTVTAPDLYFITESNFETSGGFGPNQVSSMMSLGAIVAFFLLLGHSWSAVPSIVLVAVTCGLSVQAVLTFSRGGVYMLVMSFAVGTVLFLRRRASGIRAGFAILAVAIFAVGFAYPFLIQFTKGMVVERFSDAESKGRVRIFRNEMKVLQTSPLIGVGMGAERFVAAEMGLYIMVHNEFNRTLTEQGIIGFTVFLLFLFRAGIAATTARDVIIQACFSGMFLWACLYLFVNGFRQALPALLIAFAYLKFDSVLGVSAPMRLRRPPSGD